MEKTFGGYRVGHDICVSRLTCTKVCGGEVDRKEEFADTIC